MSKIHIEDEVMVDYVLGNLSTIDFLKTRFHIIICRRCATEMSYWKKYLPTEKSKSIIQNLGNRKWNRQRKLTYIAFSMMTIILLFIINHGNGNKEIYHDQLLQANHEKLYNPSEYGFQSQANMEYIQTITHNPYNSLFRYIDSNKLEINELAHQFSHPVEIPIYDNNSKYFFASHDEPICLIDKNAMKMTCVLYIFDKNRNKYIPLQVETYDIKIDDKEQYQLNR